VNWIAGLQCSVCRRREVIDSFYKRGKAVHHNGEEISTRCSKRTAPNCARTVLDALLINTTLISSSVGAWVACSRRRQLDRRGSQPCGHVIFPARELSWLHTKDREAMSAHREMVGRSEKSLEWQWRGTELKQWWSSVGAAASSRK
jgi:hypothetical protein